VSSDQHIVDVTGLTGGYGRTTVFHELSFQVKPGEALAILGQNGSGKSTLLKTLAGLLVPQAGNVRLADLNGSPKLLAHALVRAGISYCPQGGLVIPELTVAEHLQLATQHHAKAEASEARDEALATFPKLKGLLQQRAGTLSGGQRQQVSLAILVAHLSQLWLLDEPTAGLAPELVKTTTGFLQERVKKNGTALILVEHNLDVAIALADRILVLREGRVVRTIENVQAMEHELDHEQIYY
jgi:ABC-type branched-subunit amino acid transport system ATPase component